MHSACEVLRELARMTPFAYGRPCSVSVVGHRVAAVVAESLAAAEAGVRALRIEYQPLPAILDPQLAMLPGAPVLHDLGPESGADDARRNIPC